MNEVSGLPSQNNEALKNASDRLVRTIVNQVWDSSACYSRAAVCSECAYFDKKESVEVSCSFENLRFMIVKNSASVIVWTKKARRNSLRPKLQQPSEIYVYFGVYIMS